MAPAAGSYRLFGHQMPIFDEARLKERLRMGLVFETGQIFNHLTVRENISLPLRYHYNLGKAEAADRVNELLEALELGPWADSTPGAIGRNWQKRVGLGRALILQPELLLLDNPVAGLDLRHLDFWMKFLEELRKGHPFLKRRPLTLAVTTADLRPWRGGPHRFAILKDKKMTVLGSGAEAEQASATLLKDLIVLDDRL
jgi:ABC-type transporter Mla maintaining outer membrane lipid asymmetry ATPase subunit MlaF